MLNWIFLSHTYYLGLTEQENSSQLNDVMLLRIANRLRQEHLIPLAAGLLGSVKYLENIQANFSDLRMEEHAYLILAEWRKRTRNQRGNTSAQGIVKILMDVKIDHHLVCLVCYILDVSCFRFACFLFFSFFFSFFFGGGGACYCFQLQQIILYICMHICKFSKYLNSWCFH